MSEKNIDALENTYNQVDTTRDRRAGGIGLGLAISRKMIAKMNGHMHIESVPDAGTTVSIIIPQRVLTDMPLYPCVMPEIKRSFFIWISKDTVSDSFVTDILNVYRGWSISFM